jgi:hypothetical protein
VDMRKFPEVVSFVSSIIRVCSQRRTPPCGAPWPPKIIPQATNMVQTERLRRPFHFDPRAWQAPALLCGRPR